MAITPIFLRCATGSASASKLRSPAVTGLVVPIISAMAALRAIWQQSKSWRSRASFRAAGASWLVMADEARELLFTGLQQSLEHAAFGLDAGQVVFVFERVDVDQIHLVDLQVLQAPLDGGLNRGA